MIKSKSFIVRNGYLREIYLWGPFEDIDDIFSDDYSRDELVYLGEVV